MAQVLDLELAGKNMHGVSADYEPLKSSNQSHTGADNAATGMIRMDVIIVVLSSDEKGSVTTQVLDLEHAG
jgi:hypothetical protein